jgi:multiple sugar transport system ATP-binding protein
MAGVVFEHVYKRYTGNVVAITDMNVEIRDKEFMVLVGPSGCGKSTALRMVAGLEEISDGTVKIGDRVVNDVPPKDRDIAMVFQSYALYPHMSVYDNLSFGLKLRKTPKSEIDKRVREAARVLGLENLLDRKPKALSGGQRQRVALGRAIVRQPKAFLMDEPLSNLDAKLRVQTRVEILKLHQRLQTTFIYVTHDQVEAMTMGDRIVVLKDGFVQQVDTPQTLYQKPVNLFVAGFIGSPAMNFLPASIGGDGQAQLKGDGFTVPVAERLLDGSGAARGQEVIMGVRPEDLKDSRYSEGTLPRVTAKVEVVESMGSEIFAYINVGGRTLTSRMDPRSADLEPGQTVQVAVDTSHIHLFDPKSEKALVSGGTPARV